MPLNPPSDQPLPTPVDPPELPRSPVFAQAMSTGPGRTVHVGGQNGVDGTGALAHGLAAQTVQAFENLATVLAAAGATPEHVVKLSIHLADGVDATEAFGAAAGVWRQRTAVTVLTARPIVPGALIEVDAVAVVA